MQSFCDLETDPMSAARFAAPDPNATPPSRAPGRESWLDRLARALAPGPVDQPPIVPGQVSAAQELVRSHRAAPQCCTPAGQRNS